MLDPKADRGASLFERYNRIMRGTFVAVLLVACALIYRQYVQQRDSELEILTQRMQEHAISLDAILKSSTDAVKALRIQSATWYATHPGQADPSPLLAAVLTSSAAGRVNLNAVPPPWKAEDVGNLTGAIDAPDASLLKEMEMALDLDTTFKAAKRNIPNATWIYYTSKRRFINIYPWIASSEFDYSDNIHKKQFYLGVTPEKNPERSVLWTEAYLDEAGKGVMVTASTGIYEGDTFRGAVSLDLTLDQLNTLVRSWQLRFGTLFIINDHDQLLAHPTLIKADAKDVLPAASALPEGLRLDALKPADGKMRLIGDYYVETLEVRNAPFRLVLVVPRIDLMVSTLKGGISAVALLVGGLTLIVLLSNLLARREAILPAQQLVRYIEDESRGGALSIPPVPPAWLPWFETIKRVFNANTQLASIQQELDVARRMQQSIVPTRFPSRPDLKLFARMIPAKEVGGDFYDYFWLSDKKIGIVIADVSGKGVPAALFMAVARTLLRATAPAAVRPGACLTLTNNLLSQDNEATMFVTLFYGIIDMETHELTYANGGHNPPLILGPSGEIKTLPQTGGMALGVMEDIPYGEQTITLEPGSLLLLYTDGVTEAFSPSNEEFTEARLITTLAACQNLPVEETLERIVTAVTGFADTAPQSDDITCLAVRYDLLSDSVST